MQMNKLLYSRSVYYILLLFIIIILVKEFYYNNNKLNFKLSTSNSIVRNESSTNHNKIDLWFTIIDGSTPAYHLQLKVALISAKVYTSLIPIVIFLNENDNLYNWLIENNIIVYKNISNFKIVKFFKDHKEYLGHLGLATWLRLTLPEIINNLKTTENYIIKDLENKLNRTISLDYIVCTDVDVFFINPFNPSFEVFPRYVSFAVQGNNHIRTDNAFSSTFHLNAGIMILNASSINEWEDEFHNFAFKQILLRNGPNFEENVFEDQGAFHRFFPPRFKSKSIIDYINLLIFHKTYYYYLFAKYYSSSLPKEYEWEPYLGVNLDAVIIHWHGPKFYYPDNCSIIYDPVESSKYNYIINSFKSTQEEIIKSSRSNSRRVLTSNLLHLLPQSTAGYKHATILLYKFLNILCNRE